MKLSVTAARAIISELRRRIETGGPIRRVAPEGLGGRRRFLQGLAAMGAALAGVGCASREPAAEPVAPPSPTAAKPVAAPPSPPTESGRESRSAASQGTEERAMRPRPIVSITQSRPTREGAGVSLRRAFGFQEEGDFDPFLLLDDFRSDDPAQYRAGFPWHPHRGMETITYVLEGEVEHGDSLGNKGVIGRGDVQWMTAGSGIVHQEMPRGDDQGRMYGFQLWANLPARQKMMEPRYQEVTSREIPVVTRPDGVQLRIIAGAVDGVRGPVRDVVIEPEYLDVSAPALTSFVHDTPRGHAALAYVFEGSATFGGPSQPESMHGDGTLLRFGDGDRIELRTGAQAVRFLLISGKPLGEPIAWRGPIVMNTEAELQTAFEEYRAGTFLRHR